MRLQFLQDIGYLIHALSESGVEGYQWHQHLAGIGYMINDTAGQVKDTIERYEQDLERKGISRVTRTPLNPAGSK